MATSNPIGATVRVDTVGIQAVLSEAKTRAITLKGVKAGVRVLQTAARSFAPRRKGSGALRQSQGVLAKKGKKGTTLSFAVQGARKRVVKFVKLRGRKKPVKVVPAFYDHLVQGGTKPHRLGKGETLGRSNRRKPVAVSAQASGGRHPGTKPNPYRKRAWQSVKGEVGDVTRRAMLDELRKIIERQRAKGK